MGIAHVPMTAEREAVVMGTLIRGNLLLKSCANLMDLSHRDFRAQVAKGFDWSKMTVDQVAAVQAALPHIEAVRKVEMEVVSHHVRVAQRMALSFLGQARRHVLAYDDLLQEALMGLTDAVYGYTDGNLSQFITFATTAIIHRLQHLANRAVQDDRRLKVESQFMEDESQNDYTYLFSSDEWAEPVVEEVIRKEEGVLVREALERAKLTPRERQVIDLFMKEPASGRVPWKLKLGLNPVTQRPWSRQTISDLLQSAKRKIKNVLKVKEVA